MRVGLVIALVASLARAGTDDAQTALERGRQLGDLYNWSDAAPYFVTAERLFNERGDARNALYAKLGGIRSTMEQVSLPQMSAWLATELENDPLLKADDELRLFALIVKGDIDGELNAGPMRLDWEAVRDLARKLRNERWVNRAGGEIGFSYYLEGDLTSARQMVGAALLTATMTGDVGGQIRYLAAIGTALVLAHNARDALSYFDKALKAANAHPEVGYQFLIHEGRVLAYKQLGQWKEARAISDEMLAEARIRKKYVKECQGLITASAISVETRQYDRGEAELREAIRLAGRGGFARLLADAQADLAELYQIRGDLVRAEQMAQTAAQATQDSGEVYLIPSRLELLGRLQAMRGEYAAADAAYSKASEFMETMLAGDPNAAGKSSLIMVMSDLYTGHFALLADHFQDASRVYSVLERARGRVTLDVLSKRTGIDRNKAVAVERQISQLHLKLLAARSSAQLHRVRDQIFLAEQSRWLIEQRQAQSEARRTISLAEVRKTLAPGEMLLEYVLADPRSYCLVIAREFTRIIPLASRAKIEPLVTDVVASAKARKVDRLISAELYRELLGRVPSIESHTRLIIVPDGRLQLLPFDALVESSGRYVLESHVISYAPSASAYYLLARMPAARRFPAGVLALGGVPYASTPSNKLALTERLTKAALADLPGSEDEVLVPGSMLRASATTQLVGSNATEAAFKHADLERQEVIHLSVHAVTDENHPDRAALIMMSDPAAGEDGILQAREIMNLQLNADLVVLSACDTAAGRLLGEEGISTLSRAFQLAGAHSVVSTLWSVDDTFSLNLMKRFYSRLGEGEAIAEALAGAKRELIHEFGDRAVPYYWAGFIVDGAADRSIKFGREDGVRTAVHLDRNDRKTILDNIRKLVPAKHINVSSPHQDYAFWIALLDSRRPALERAGSVEEFETGVRELLAALGTSHTAFFRIGQGVPPVHAIHATLRSVPDGNGSQRWMFLDVIEDGPAHQAGIRPGELLAAADGESMVPPAQPRFRIGGAHRLDVIGLDGAPRSVTVEVPDRRAKDRPPMVEPRSITHRMIAPSVGYLKVASFPGAVGMGFAQSLDAAIVDLKQHGCQRLIIDLRGNVGGGLGSLRLMSYLCPGKLPIGYSLTRKRLRNGFEKEKLVRINRIPAGKGDLLLMALRFKIIHRDRSMVLETEGLGPQPFHGRIAMLVNEFTNSAAEMVASFAAENKLATLIGTRTGGQVLGGANIKLAKGYRLRMPVAGWYTWSGECIEGRGVAPDVEVDLTRDALARGADTQLQAALSNAGASAHFAAG